MHIKTIWLADDDPDDCMLFADALEELDAPITVTCFETAIELQQQLNDSPTLPDLILLDVNMPTKTGIQCLKEIKEEDSLAEVPVIVWSTGNAVNTILQAFELGARLYIQKPTSFDRLKDIVNKTLRLNLADKVLYENFRVG